MKYLIQLCNGNNYVDAYLILNEQTITIQNNEMNMLIYMAQLTNCVQNQNSITLFFNGNQVLLFSNRANEIKNKIDKLKQKSNDNIYQKSHKISKIEVILACFVFGAVAIYGLVESSKDIDTSYIENNQSIDNTSNNEEKNIIEEKSEKDIFIEKISKEENPYNNTNLGYEKAYDILKDELHFTNIKFKEKTDPSSATYIVEVAGLTKFSKLNVFVVIDNDNVSDISCDTVILYQDGITYITYDDILQKCDE